jgi:hypothetical protein
MPSGSKPAEELAEERWRTSPLWGDVTPPETAEPAPVRKKVKRDLHKQRKSQIMVNGNVVDQWAEPRLSFDEGGKRVGVFDDTKGEKTTMADRLAEADLHRVSGAPLAHTGATCGGCVHFRLKPRLGGELTSPGAVGKTGQPVMGMLVCDWAGPITRSVSFPRTSAGEPACVHHQSRAGGEVIVPTMRPLACRSCGDPVVWCKTGKGRMQVDAEPVDNGNIEVVRWEGSTPVIAVHGKDFEWPEGVDRYVSHFVTCVDAESWRKRANNDSKGAA